MLFKLLAIYDRMQNYYFVSFDKPQK